MSGGSLDYAYVKVEEAAGRIANQARADNDSLRAAFAVLLFGVATALHDAEWVMSGDWGDGDDEEAIRAVVNPAMELDAARRMAEAARSALDRAIERASNEERDG